jgi:4-oxalomesaconate tautomerase
MFIPHRVHTSIGVLAAVTAGTAAAIEGSVAALRARPADLPPGVVRLEHPTGFFDAVIDVTTDPDGAVKVGRSAIVSTARLLLSGTVFPRPSTRGIGTDG